MGVEKMNCLVKPYEGEKPYIFFSYCHEDSGKVYPVIERMAREGYRIWYDDGIHPGDDWPQVIAEHIERADVCIAAISENSSRSHSCKNEVSFVVSENKTLLSVILESFRIPLGMKLQISGSNFINMFEYADPEQFYARLMSASCCDICRGDPQSVPEREPERKSEPEPEREPEKEKEAKKEAKKDSVNLKRKTIIIRPRKTKEEKEPEKEPETQQTSEAELTPEKDEVKNEEEFRRNLGKFADEGEDESTVVELGHTVTLELDELDRTVIVDRKSVQAFAYVIRVATGESFAINSVETTMGRSARHAKLVVEDESNTISKHHADIFIHEGRFYLRDNKSGNGTFLHERELEPNESVELADIDVFSLSNEVFFFVAKSRKELMDRIVQQAKLSVLIADETQEWRVLTGEPLPLDRYHQWQGGVLGDKYVHREGEAELLFVDNSYCLHNINSANGCTVNGRRLERGEQMELKDGNTVTIAYNRFIYKEIPMKIREGK